QIHADLPRHHHALRPPPRLQFARRHAETTADAFGDPLHGWLGRVHKCAKVLDHQSQRKLACMQSAQLLNLRERSQELTRAAWQLLCEPNKHITADSKLTSLRLLL